MPVINESKRSWLTARQIADYLGVKVSTVYSWVSDGRVPYHKIPGSHLLRFYVEEIDAWIVSGTD